MRLGEFDEIISETSEFPGSIGDSCANTARHYHLKRLLEYPLIMSEIITLQMFRTPDGYIRHWDAPKDWRETDMTSDQLIPLFISYSFNARMYAQEMTERLRKNWWRTGNGDFVTPALYALATNKILLLKIILKIQECIFRFPYRWSDSTKWFEKTETSSADYLNYYHLVKYSGAKFGVDQNIVLDKIADYYKPEPDSYWLVYMYRLAIHR